jgi:hypothetical protein
MPLPTDHRQRSFLTAPSIAIAAFLVGLLAIAWACGGAGGDSSAAMLLPDRIGEWVRQDSADTYDRETIFDYINGAGEVYRSYAFHDVIVVRYAKTGGPEMTVELFDMGNTDDAYGVFSYARESEEAGIGGGFERKGSVLCFWQSQYYVCVASGELGVDAADDLEEIARGISQQMPAGSERPSLVSMLPAEGLIPISDRFFHTHQSLNYHYYLARDNVLSLSEETDVVLGRYAPGSTYVVIVSYPNEEDATRALLTFRARYLPEGGDWQTVETQTGTFISSLNHGSFLLVLLDAVSSQAAEALRDAAIAKMD